MTRRTAVSPLLLARIFGLVAAYLPSLLAESGYRQLGGGIAPSPELVDGHSRRALRSAPPVPPVGSTTTISCQVQFDGLALSDRFEPAGQRDFNTLDCVCVRLRVSSDQPSTEGVMSCVIWGALPALLVRYSCYSRAHGGTRTDDSARSCLLFPVPWTTSRRHTVQSWLPQRGKHPASAMFQTYPRRSLPGSSSPLACTTLNPYPPQL